MSAEVIKAKYLIETPLSLEQAAEAIAGEQSSGTFTAVPGETEELRARARARVEQITELGDASAPSLPGSKYPQGATFRRGEVIISFPYDNVGTNLPTLLSTVMGNLYELRELSGLRLLDLTFPEAYKTAYPGPQFGIQGTRELTGVYDRPIIGTIIKPSVGLRPEETAQLVRTVAEAGLDFIKDDELMANPPHSPLEQRVEAVMRVVNELADKTGKKVMVAFNITDELDAMLRHHDTVLKAGGTCVMASLNSVGPVGISYLRRHSQLPIHGHRNGWGMLTRYPYLGMTFTAYQKIWRLIGIDHLHVNGLNNKFWEPDESVITSIKACLTPMFSGYHLMPVISSGQSAKQAPDTYRQAGTTDLMFLAGGGIMAHPSGPAAGVASLQQAWQAAVENVALERYADTHPELAQALEKFASKDQA